MTSPEASIILGRQPSLRSAGPIGYTRCQSSDPESASLVRFHGEGNAITIAPTGKGKGVSALIPNLLTYPGAVIVVDVKGENHAITERARRQLGPVFTLNPFRLTEQESDALNPFDLMASGSDIESSCEQLAHLISGVSGTSFQQDPYWDTWGRSLITGLLHYIVIHEPPERRHLGTLREFLKADDVVYGLALLLDQNKREGWEMGYREISSFLQLAEKTRSGVLSTAQSFTAMLNSAAVRESLNRTTVDLDRLRRGEPMTIYLVIPPNRLHSHRKLLRLWVSSLLDCVLNRTQRPRLDTLFMLDECAQLGELETLRTAMTLMRGYGLRVWAFFQDLSQVQRLYPRDWQSLINNASILQVFGINSHMMARTLSELLGDIKPGRLLSMSGDMLAVTVTGQPTRILRRTSYLSDPEFKSLFDANPFFASSRSTPA